MTDPIDYEAVLEDLRSKRAQIDKAIAGIETILGLAPTDGVTDTGADPGGSPKVVRDDSFLGMSTPAAAVAYLKMMKKPQTTAEVAAALERGGIHSTSDNFTNTVYTALHRAAKAGEAIRLGKKWSLKEWHPGARSGKKPTLPDPSTLPVWVPSDNPEDDETEDF